MSDVERLSDVVGRNARSHRLKHGATLDDVARQARANGLRWTTGRVGDLESGRVPITVPTLFAVAQALGSATRDPIAMSELVSYSGWVEVNPDLTVRGDTLAAAFAGQPVDLRARDLHGKVEAVFAAMEELQGSIARDPASRDPNLASQPAGDFSRVEAQSGSAEDRTRKELGISRDYLTGISLHLWGRSLSAERDSRAGSDANPQRKGQVTRELKQEIQNYIGGDRGNH